MRERPCPGRLRISRADARAHDLLLATGASATAVIERGFEGLSRLLFVVIALALYALSISMVIAGASQLVLGAFGGQVGIFNLMNGVGLLISDACILIVERGFGKTGALWFTVAQVAGLALGMVFRFTTYKRWVFVSPERAAARSLAQG